MKRITLLLITASIFLIAEIVNAQAIHNDSLTVQDAIDLTIKNYPLIKEKQEELKAAEYKIEQQKSSYYPKLEGEVDYSRLGPLQTIEFGGIAFNLSPAYNFNTDLLASATLYDFGKRNSEVELYSSMEQSTKDDINLVKTSLAYQTVGTFYTIIFLNQSVAVKDTQIAALQEHLRITNKKIESGSSTDYDALSTDVRISDAQNEKIELQNEARDQEIQLRKFLGLTQDSILNITGNFDLSNYSLNYDSLLTVAFLQRPELKLAYDAVNTAKMQKNIAGKTDMPSLNAELSYGIRNGFEPDLDVLRGNWLAGISLQVPIFNGFLRRYKEDEAEANLDESSIKITEVKRQITADVQQALNELKSNLDKLNTAKTQVNFAEQTVERARQRYESGVGTNLDLLDAETSMAQARLLNLQVLYKCILSNYMLRRAIGDKIYGQM
jgi:outer membrane protein